MGQSVRPSLLSTCPYSRLTGQVRYSFSAVGTAWPATRPAHSFLNFCAYPLNVLPSGFRPLDGDDPADPFIAREWRNILPFCSRRRVRNENFSQIRWYSVYRTTGDRSLGHGFQSISNWRGTCPCSRQPGSYPETGFETISLKDHTERAARGPPV